MTITHTTCLFEEVEVCDHMVCASQAQNYPVFPALVVDDIDGTASLVGGCVTADVTADVMA